MVIVFSRNKKYTYLIILSYSHNNTCGLKFTNINNTNTSYKGAM